ncbi:mitochondrial ribosome-associated GTPase 1 isoform X2 [Stegostoma tigrinum]|uniref:mitochondrial ribosome-associated GTPase 1 isoform X2 n=1 Tax=Stegostoma tigrinum TaxID=3053191 RepID=UPI00202B150D|nr:mitochondrial ribosome-associated GTPase 1 isoform X2 [Stegostoma tigrinum]
MRCGAALAALRFRTSFEFGNRELAKWFPGHMAKGLKKMQASLKKVDCIIEVHDARIPLSGRNPMFEEALGVRPHLLVLNKMDLADLTNKQRIMRELEQQRIQNVLFTDCLRERDVNVKKIVPAVTELIQKGDRFHRMENLEYCLMVIGVPNVGKSSLINAMRRMYLKKGKASRVGGEPGITRAVLTKIQVCERPLIYLLDTPGVFSPRVESLEVGMKLALCGTILDHLVGEEVIADYLLFTLNKQQKFDYVDRYQLGEPCDDVQTVLKKIAVNLGKTQKVKAITGVVQLHMISSEHSGKVNWERSCWTDVNASSFKR